MENPESYMTGNSLQRSGVRDFSDEFVNEIRTMSGHCLDVGSGPGDTVVDFILPKLNPNAKLICSDISEEMVSFGKERYKNNKRVSYIKLDIETLYVPKDLIEYFNHITSFYCIHWCQDMRRVFGNMFTLLRPGGTILLNFVANHPIYDVYTTLAAIPRYQSYMKDVDRYIPSFQHVEHRSEILETLLNYIGFEVHRCSFERRTYIYETPETLQNFALALNPFIKRMPADLKEEYKKDLIKELTTELNINDEDESEYSKYCIYYISVAYLKKPMTM